MTGAKRHGHAPAPAGPVALWILGAGGHGRVVADAAAASRQWAAVIFFDDDPARGPRVGRFGVRGDSRAFLNNQNGRAVQHHVAIGDNALREQVVQRCEALGLTLATVVHPAAVVSAEARLAAGCFVAAGAVVAPGAVIDAGGIVNHGATVDHDAQLGRAVHVSPGAHLGGAVTVGSLAWIGLGAAVRHEVRIGRRVMVGAGAVVVADVPDDSCVVGNPARPMLPSNGPLGPPRPLRA
jgi:sugar O-acyltransferase (sialic acid O-acetyltransferase NeuD family)